MAKSFDSNVCNGFQITEIGEDDKEAPSQTSLSLYMASHHGKDLSSLASSSIVRRENAEYHSGGGEFESTVQEKQEPFLALSAAEGAETSVASCNLHDAVRELVLASSRYDEKDVNFSKEHLNIGKGKQEQFGSVKFALEDGNGAAYSVKHDMGRSGMQESMEPHEEKPLGLEDVLEVRKKRLLEEIEAVLLPKDELACEKKSGCKEMHKMLQEDLHNRRSLGIEVIDDTALIETIPSPAIAKKSNVRASLKCKEMDVKNEKRSKRRAKGRHKSVHGMDEIQNGLPREDGNETKRKYSRKEMEALRFVNVVEQRKTWNGIYRGLDTVVVNEYDTLASSENQKHMHLNYDPRQCYGKKKEASSILCAACCENMDNELQHLDNTEIVSALDPSCSHTLTGVDGCKVLEGEYSGDEDSEDYYDSIQKPAFLVEGEPDFDSGPPEDGWEYIRRVRWEAAQIPRVKVAKLDRSKLDKEQSAYMPKIPDIAKCAEHLLPLKQWEDAFLAEFSELRANFSRLEGSSAFNTINLEPAHPLHPSGNNLGKFHGAMTKDDLVEPVVTAEVENRKLPPKNPSSKISVDESSNIPPLLSLVLGMDYAARGSMLRKRITLLEPADTITRNDCMWLFALCVMIDTPLDADTCASLRSLLRKCAKLRAGKAELDDEVVMLNILATISGRYFRQSDN